MTDSVYKIQKEWLGSNSSLEAATENYIGTGETWAAEKMEFAIRKLAPEFYPIFGDKTDAILNDRVAVGDGDRDGFIDMNLKHIFSKYYSTPAQCGKNQLCSLLRDDLAARFTAITGILINPYSSWVELKERMLDTFQASGRLYLTEYFADSLFRGKRWKTAESAGFDFDRYDISAASKYFWQKYSGVARPDEKWISALSRDIEKYFSWATVHLNEEVDEAIRIDPKKGLSSFSKDDDGRARINCRLMTELAEHLIKGITDSSGRPVFKPSRGHIFFKARDYGHEVLIAEFSAAKDESQPVRRLIVNNGFVEFGEADRIENDLRISGGESLKAHEGYFAAYVNPPRTLPFKFDGINFIAAFASYLERRWLQLPYDDSNEILPRFASTAIDAINSGELEMAKLLSSGVFPQLLAAITKYAVDAGEPARRQEAVDAAAKIIKQANLRKEYSLAMLGLLTRDGRAFRELKTDESLLEVRILKNLVREETGQDKDAGGIDDIRKYAETYMGEELADLLFTDRDSLEVGFLDLPRGTLKKDPVAMLESICPKNELYRFYEAVGKGFESRGENQRAYEFFSKALSEWPKGDSRASKILKETVRLASEVEGVDTAKFILETNGDLIKRFGSKADKMNLATALFYAGDPVGAAKIIKSPRFKGDLDAVKLALDCEHAINGKSKKLFSLLERFAYLVREKFLDIRVYPDSYTVRPRQPYDSVRYAGYLLKLAEINAELGRYDRARDFAKSASSWDPYMEYTLNRIFSTEDRLPEWAQDKCICADETGAQRCESPADQQCVSTSEPPRSLATR